MSYAWLQSISCSEILSLRRNPKPEKTIIVRQTVLQRAVSETFRGGGGTQARLLTARKTHMNPRIPRKIEKLCWADLEFDGTWKLRFAHKLPEIGRRRG